MIFEAERNNFFLNRDAPIWNIISPNMINSSILNGFKSVFNKLTVKKTGSQARSRHQISPTFIHGSTFDLFISLIGFDNVYHNDTWLSSSSLSF